MKFSLRDYTILQRGPWADVAFWTVYTLVTQLAFAPAPFAPSNLLVMLAFLAGELVAVYGHLYLGLFPLLRREGSIVRYLLSIVAAVVVGVTVTWGCVLLVGVVLPEVRPSVGPTLFWTFWANRVGWSIGTLLALASVLVLFSHRRRQAARERELEIARTEAELAYLRGQLNPHFLFNALNNIYILIDHDPGRARESLLGFSDLLRYQLYVSEADRVPLATELDHIRQYAALSRLRMEEDFRFELTVADGATERELPPLLLLPLVENAFKYSPRQGGRVSVRLGAERDRTRFTIQNTVGGTATADPDPTAGGIGLTNLRRRLELLYPGRFRLATEQSNDHFTVTLELPHA